MAIVEFQLNNDQTNYVIKVHVIDSNHVNDKDYKDDIYRCTTYYCDDTQDLNGSHNVIVVGSYDTYIKPNFNEHGPRIATRFENQNKYKQDNRLMIEFLDPSVKGWINVMKEDYDIEFKNAHHTSGYVQTDPRPNVDELLKNSTLTHN
jgi:hypothetical protein